MDTSTADKAARLSSTVRAMATIPEAPAGPWITAARRAALVIVAAAAGQYDSRLWMQEVARDRGAIIFVVPKANTGVSVAPPPASALTPVVFLPQPRAHCISVAWREDQGGALGRRWVHKTGCGLQ